MQCCGSGSQNLPLISDCVVPGKPLESSDFAGDFNFLLKFVLQESVTPSYQTAWIKLLLVDLLKYLDNQRCEHIL